VVDDENDEIHDQNDREDEVVDDEVVDDEVEVAQVILVKIYQLMQLLTIKLLLKLILIIVTAQIHLKYVHFNVIVVIFGMLQVKNVITEKILHELL
jgi:hypothetical protein